MIRNRRQIPNKIAPYPWWQKSVFMIFLFITLQNSKCISKIRTKISAPDTQADDEIINTSQWQFEKNIAESNFDQMTRPVARGREPYRTLLYAAIRGKDEAKLDAIVKRIDVLAKKEGKTKELLSSLLFHKPDLKSGKTPLERAIETNNREIITALLQSKYIDILKLMPVKDKGDVFPLVFAASHSKDQVFEPMWNKIKEQENKDSQKKHLVDKYLFLKNDYRYSVFACAYLSTPTTKKNFFPKVMSIITSADSPGVKMFKSMLHTLVSDCSLEESDVLEIKSEIELLYKNINKKGAKATKKQEENLISIADSYLQTIKANKEAAIKANTKEKQQ